MLSLCLKEPEAASQGFCRASAGKHERCKAEKDGYYRVQQTHQHFPDDHTAEY